MFVKIGKFVHLLKLDSPMPNEGTQIYRLEPSSRGILPSYNKKEQSSVAQEK